MDQELMHYSKGYDPVKAHEYYMRTRKLKGRPTGRRRYYSGPGTPIFKRNKIGSARPTGAANYQGIRRGTRGGDPTRNRPGATRSGGANILATGRVINRKTKNKARIARGKKAVTNFLNKITGKKPVPPPHASTHYAKPKPNTAHKIGQDIKRRTKGNTRLEYGKRAVVKYAKKAGRAAKNYAKKEAAYIRREARRRAPTQADRWK